MKIISISISKLSWQAQFHKANLIMSVLLGLCLLMGIGLSREVHAQENWPQKPIRLLLGFPAGGGSDIVARLIAKSLGDRIGQNVMVDNKPGAGGNIATEILVRAPGDGYTLLLVPSGHASGAATWQRAAYQRDRGHTISKARDVGFRLELSPGGVG